MANLERAPVEGETAAGLHCNGFVLIIVDKIHPLLKYLKLEDSIDIAFVHLGSSIGW